MRKTSTYARRRWQADTLDVVRRSVMKNMRKAV